MDDIVTVASFEGDCGENGYARVKGGHLSPGQYIELNRSLDLSKCVRGNDDACAYYIGLKTLEDSIYRYSIEVEARGPKGFGTGSMYFAFKDDSGDIYHVSAYDSSRKVHTVHYNSDHPHILEFKWNNYSISDW